MWSGLKKEPGQKVVVLSYSYSSEESCLPTNKPERHSQKRAKAALARDRRHLSEMFAVVNCCWLVSSVGNNITNMLPVTTHFGYLPQQNKKKSSESETIAAQSRDKIVPGVIPVFWLHQMI